MADAIASVTEAPKDVLQFGQKHLLAFLLLVVLLAVIFVRYETTNPGAVRMKVAKLPGIGPWATGQKPPPA